VVNNDSLRSYFVGMALEKEALKESCSFKPEGRGVRSKSGGSSTSATMSSSEAWEVAMFVGWFCIARLAGVLCMLA